VILESSDPSFLHFCPSGWIFDEILHEFVYPQFQEGFSGRRERQTDERRSERASKHSKNVYEDLQHVPKQQQGRVGNRSRLFPT
jgi:hypothetical protein